MRKQRVDVILHILTDKVEPDFRRSELRVSLNFEQPTYSKIELQHRKVAQGLDSAEAEEMIAYDENSDDLVVQSFSTEDMWYTVGVRSFGDLEDTEDGAIVSCDCPAFNSSYSTCKHMFLVSRISHYSIRRFSTASIPVPILAPSLPLAPQDLQAVLAEKTACIDRILDEGAAFNSLMGRLKDTDLSATSRQDLTDLESAVVRIRRDLSSIISHRLIHSSQHS